jgi:hypothetical protein
MSNLKYSFVKQETEDGNFVFRCEVSSFGLNNTTDKDIVSFYKNLSKYSYFDSGLMPVSGNGLLSLRYADNHTQIVYQHAPSINHVNWGKYEGDSMAPAYYVAQPYRIVIADLLDGNFYGARIFYSPYPITHPDAPLYHVNLPNINCRGYRGNGVGWVCLYHTTDITTFPFNEKLAHVLERCSGIEAYNDANMSETDGPRFYADYHSSNQDYEHLWNPSAWQTYTQQYGLDWVYDSDSWIPVLVTDIDNQDKHDHNGVPLTISMAMLGNYQAYYTDSLIPKPVNAIARFPEKFTNQNVENIFKKSFNSSSTQNLPTNVYSESSLIKNTLVHTPLIGNTSEDAVQQEDDSDFFNCDSCGDSYDPDVHESYTHESGLYCENCWMENFIYIEYDDTYVKNDHPNLAYDNYRDVYFLTSTTPNIQCINCEEYYSYDVDATFSNSSLGSIPVYHSFDGQPNRCYSCLNDDSFTCFYCKDHIPDSKTHSVERIYDPHSSFVNVCNHCYNKSSKAIKKIISESQTKDLHTYCICGDSVLFSNTFRNIFPLKNDVVLDVSLRTITFNTAVIANKFYSENKDLLTHCNTNTFNFSNFQDNISISHLCFNCHNNILSLMLSNSAQYPLSIYKNFVQESFFALYSLIENGEESKLKDIISNSLSFAVYR